MIDPQIELLAEVDAYIQRTGLSETAFGKLAVSDGKFVGRLRARANMTIGTMLKARAFISAASKTAGC
jgi:hypothetical protein